MSGRGIFGDKTIIYVEDDPLIAEHTLTRLRAMGFARLLFASDLCQAEELMRAQNIDIALLDVHIGPVNTLDLANALAERGAHIVFTSGYTRDELGDRLGDFAFVQKPYSIGALSIALEASINDTPGSLAAE